MPRQLLPIRFADLHRLAREVPVYLAAQSYVSETPALAAGVENELGLAGPDTAELILRFAEVYNVELVSFDFTGYLTPEEPDLLLLPLLAYLLLAWLLRTAIGAGCWLFSRRWARCIWQHPLPRFWLPATETTLPKTLTFGDFVASAAAGRFVKREQVRFQLRPV